MNEFDDPYFRASKLCVDTIDLWTVNEKLDAPFRSDAGITSSKTDDNQAGYKGGSATSATITTNADFLLHSAGWLLNGMYISPGKLLRKSNALESLYP